MQPPHDPPRRKAPTTASARETPMFIATPGFTPNVIGRDSSLANKDTMAAISSAAHATAISANKENFNFIPDIAESIKHRRRDATKKFAKASPPKPTPSSFSLPMLTDVAMAAVSPTPLQKRNLPNGSMAPPSPKRPRCQNEAHVLDTVKDPQRQPGNIAGLLHSETFEIILPSSIRSPPSMLAAESPNEDALSDPQATQQRNVMPSLISTPDPNAGLQLDGTTDRVMRMEPEQLQPHPNELLPIANRNQYGLQSNPLKSSSLDSEQHSLSIDIYRPRLYPDVALQPRSHPQLHPQEAPKSLHGNMPSSYPQPHLQPIKAGVEPLGEQLPTQDWIGTQDENDQTPSRYPQPTTQSSRVPLTTGIMQQQAESVCERDVPISSMPAQEYLSKHGLVPLPEHIKAPVQPFKSQQRARLPETEAFKDPKSAETVSCTTTPISNTVIVVNKRPHMNDGGSASSSDQDKNTLPPTRQPARTSPDDAEFITQVKDVLDRQRQWKKATFGKRQAGRIFQVLSIAKRPDNSEALYLSGDEAAQYLRPNIFFPGIIITMDEQPRPLQSTTEFLEEFYDDSATVSVQDPAVESSSKKAAAPRNVTVGQLKQRFLQDGRAKKKNQPWNCLELATHVEDGLRPAFLSGEDCRLLTKLKHPSKENEKDKAGRRGYLEGWKEVEKWALLAQAGALTEPHQDSHGYNTYITVNQGVIGFGWLANPSAEERAQWRKSPHAFAGGKWRYVVLRPGHTVYFPSGTVHFVFRLEALGDTLAFGGHVLRCSQIVRWIKTLLEEQADPAVTNEDLTESAPAYLDRVEKFVKQALQNERVDIWGGKENIEEFLALKAEFERRQANR